MSTAAGLCRLSADAFGDVLDGTWLDGTRFEGTDHGVTAQELVESSTVWQ